MEKNVEWSLSQCAFSQLIEFRFRTFIIVVIPNAFIFQWAHLFPLPLRLPTIISRNERVRERETEKTPNINSWLKSKYFCYDFARNFNSIFDFRLKKQTFSVIIAFSFQSTAFASQPFPLLYLDVLSPPHGPNQISMNDRKSHMKIGKWHCVLKIECSFCASTRCTFTKFSFKKCWQEGN